MTVPTPEEFLSMVEPDEPDEDFDSLPPFVDYPLDGAGVGDLLASMANSLSSIASIASIVVRRDTQESVEDETQQALNQLDREYAEIEALHDAKQALLDRVLEICKPSTSKLANSIRTAVEPMPAVVVVDEPRSAPADDAEVEEWRAYARGEGYAGPDIDKANRSQIRTMLGIPQPVAAE